MICGADGDDLQTVADRAALVARWCNTARELVDAPPNVISPAGLAERAAALPGLRVETIDPTEAGLGALAAVGASSPAPPLLVVLRHEPPGGAAAPRLGLVGKAVTFDTGGYFLKPQHDIVRQKADMGGGAAVVAALGAIAELGLPLSVTGVVPACENMLSGTAIRPTDVITTAAGLTVEVTNPDAEGRLILADALWYARRDGATHVVDLATLTGAMRAGMGDLYAGVFSPDDAWRDAVVQAGNASGDLAWPWPLHPRYRPLLDSTVADLRNTAGRSFGFPIVAATFLAQFAGEGPWAHVDMLGPALLDEDRGDAFGRGATGYGVRMLVELATRLSAAEATEGTPRYAAMDDLGGDQRERGPDRVRPHRRPLQARPRRRRARRAGPAAGDRRRRRLAGSAGDAAPDRRVARRAAHARRVLRDHVSQRGLLRRARRSARHPLPHAVHAPPPAVPR